MSPQGMRVLVDARDKLGISWQSCENEKQGMLVMSWEGRVGATGVEPCEFQLYMMALSALWADASIQEAYSRRSEFQLVSTLTHHRPFQKPNTMAEKPILLVKEHLKRKD